MAPKRLIWSNQSKRDVTKYKTSTWANILYKKESYDQEGSSTQKKKEEMNNQY